MKGGQFKLTDNQDRTERRRQIFERTVAKYASTGIRIDQDPEYMALVKLWVTGDLEMREAAEQFDAIRHRRAIARRPEKPAIAEEKTDVNTGMTQAELLRQISDLSANLRLDPDDGPPSPTEPG